MLAQLQDNVRFGEQKELATQHMNVFLAKWINWKQLCDVLWGLSHCLFQAAPGGSSPLLALSQPSPYVDLELSHECHQPWHSAHSIDFIHSLKGGQKETREGWTPLDGNDGLLKSLMNLAG